MKHLKTFESITTKTYYHGSYNELKEGTVLKPHDKSYTRISDNAFLEKILEKYRPSNKLSRYDSVFLTDKIEDVEYSGGGLDYIYSVMIPKDVIPEKSDLAWYSEIQLVKDEALQKEYALNYWNSIPYHKSESSLWEYRVPYAYIYELVEEN